MSHPYQNACIFDDGSGFNQRNAQIPYFNRHRFYGNSDFDLRDTFEVCAGWDLPFAHLLPNGPKPLNSGWSVYPIACYQSGIPLDLHADTANPSQSDGPSGFDDPQLTSVDQLTPLVETLNSRKVQTFTNPITGALETGNFYFYFYFNPAEFVANPCIAAGTCPSGFYGTFRRNSVVGPSRANFDLALEKAADLVGERLKILPEPRFDLNEVRSQNSSVGAATYFLRTHGFHVTSTSPRTDKHEAHLVQVI